IASVVFLILSPVAALSADLVLKTRPAPVMATLPIFNWTGWYIGAHLGGYSGDTSNSNGLPNVSASNAFFGVQGGYRWQYTNNLVLGIQVSAPLWTDDQNKPIIAGVTNTAKFKGSILGQGQVGLAYGRWLPFVTA